MGRYSNPETDGAPRPARGCLFAHRLEAGAMAADHESVDIVDNCDGERVLCEDGSRIGRRSPRRSTRKPGRARAIARDRPTGSRIGLSRSWVQPSVRERRDVDEPNALHRLCHHSGSIRGPVRVPQLAPVHRAAIRKDDLAIDAERRIALYLGNAGNKGEDVEVWRNRPEDVEIRVRGQIGEAVKCSSEQATEGRGLHTGPCAQVDKGGDR